ncbi:MAG: hypothetical protein G01um101449_262 [Parcubacteria group bacterium Gr01-1014_49]|nr:MAG: hypothetical protein G01um101449_262 [Parcubacteria group bacterium Gr01-1014_49]
MTKVILHGGFTAAGNTSNDAFYGEFVRDIPDEGTILLVYFASREEKEIPEKFRKHTARIQAKSEGKNFDFVIATREGFISQIEKSDAICFYGGSTSKLMEILKTYPDLKPLLAGKTVAGSSAGAYALARFGPSHHEENVREGLGIVPVRVVCHYESSTLPPNEKAITMLQNMAPEYELVLLRDFEWRVFLIASRNP